MSSPRVNWFLNMQASVSSSAQQVCHSRIRELAEVAMGMKDVLRLYFGESNLPTPDYIKRAAQKANIPPMSAPAPANPIPWPTTSLTTSAERAPRAIRTPISCIRCATL